ncbi:MAG: glucosaminidase domain-containing protein [Mangrovibacterium sp.]
MCKRFLLFVVLVMGLQTVWAQRIYSRTDYINMHAHTAVEEMFRSGVPASITLAQGCLESGNGNSELSLKSNNHFGIKCHGWSGKGMRYDDDAPNECFRVYNSVADSYADHSDFLVNNIRYAFLFNLKTTDYKGWAHGLKKAGYATDPKYAHRLINIIEENNLSKYDKMSPKDLKHSNLPEETKQVKQETTINTAVSATSTTTAGVFKNNDCNAIYVQPGDSPQSIAHKYQLNLWEIYKYNDFPKNHRITRGEIIYLQQKKKKAKKAHKYHTIQAGESLHSISQKYGIRLANLYKLNKLNAKSKIEVGQKLSLRKKMR